MITVYKTNYEFCGATYVLCFSLSENIDKQIKDWEAPLDKMVFDEQMATGRFRDRLPISDWYLTAMKEAQKDGIIQPYYGEISPSACIYTLQITPPTCVLGVEHTVVKETGLFNGAVKIRKARASKVARNHKKGFMIT